MFLFGLVNKFLFFLFFFDFIYAVDIQNQETTKFKTIDDKYAPLLSIEDVEILSFFVLINYYSRFKPKQLSTDNPAQLIEALNFNSSTLHSFLDDLKNGKLNQRFVNDQNSINCDRIDSGFYQYLLKRYNQDEKQLSKIQRLCKAATQCHSTEDLLKLIKSPNKNDDYLKFSQSIVKLCPLILFQLQDQTCKAKREQDLNLTVQKPSPGSVWGFAFLFVTIISFCSLIGVAIMPFTNKNSYQNALNLFEGLAVGSLIGSSIFHLIPQAFNLNENNNNDYLWKGLIIFGGIYLFFWSEILMKLMAELRRKKKKSSSKSNFDQIKENIAMQKLDNKNKKLKNKDFSDEVVEEDKILPKQRKVLKNNKKEKSNYHEHKHNHSHSINESQQIASVAWMIIFGDGLHNFIDGLSIGASFSESIMSGISVSVAVICEEFPHELGDFAVLIASGMTIRQAIGYNFLSACTCYLGMAVGIMIGDFTSTSSYILALAGGMFLYISLVDMMSELTNAIDEAILQSKTTMCKVMILQNIGILTGISSLFLLAKYSHNIKFEGFAPPIYLKNPFL